MQSGKLYYSHTHTHKYKVEAVVCAGEWMDNDDDEHERYRSARSIGQSIAIGMSIAASTARW
jgi:hypothetical protein